VVVTFSAVIKDARANMTSVAKVSFPFSGLGDRESERATERAWRECFLSRLLKNFVNVVGIIVITYNRSKILL